MKKIRIGLSIIIIVVSMVMFILSLMEFEIPKSVSLIAALIDFAAVIGILIILINKKE